MTRGDFFHASIDGQCEQGVWGNVLGSDASGCSRALWSGHFFFPR